MAQDPKHDRPEVAAARTASSAREDRLKAALKANLARRKAQARGRAEAGAGPDDGHGGTERPD